MIASYRKHDSNLSIVGDILRDLGNHDEGKWLYKKVLDQSDLSKQIRGQLYYNIGMMARKLERTAEAFNAFGEAANLLITAESELNPRMTPREIYKDDASSTLVVVYNNMGLLHEKRLSFDDERTCYTQALEVSSGCETEKAIVNNNLGLLHIRSGSYEQARTHFALAVEMLQNDLSYWSEFKAHLRHVESVLST